MPTYQYACTECGNQFDAVQKFSDDALTDCPKCAGKLRKVFSAVGVVFKGSGFYRNDSRGTEKTTTVAGGSSSGDSSGGSSSGSSSSGSSSSGSSSSGDSSSSSSSGSSSSGSSSPSSSPKSGGESAA